MLFDHAAFAQAGITTAMPSLGATSSLGIVPGESVGPSGLPLGTSPGVGTVPNGLTGTITVPSASSGAACSTVATSPEGTFGSPTTYDGGGMAGAAPTPATAGNAGRPVDTIRNVVVGNIHIVGNIRDVGNIDNLGNAGDIRIDGNVRLRREQRHRVVKPDSHNVVDHRTEQRHCRRSSVGILRDRKSRGQCGASRTDSKCFALCRHRGIEFAGADDARCRAGRRFIHHARYYPVKRERP